MPSPRQFVATAVIALLATGAGGAFWWQAGGQQQTRFNRSFRDDGPVPVIAALTRQDNVPVYLYGVGTVKALNTVTVRPQVDGRLISINFEEGQNVERGYVLARIDPVTYQAAYDQAVAKKAQDEALLANARRDLDRYARLAASNSVAQQQFDTQKATVAQLEAQVKLDQAVIDNARAVLGYTSIVAPIAGRTGIRLVDEGNVVRASDAAGIVVITQLQPISLLFTLPQQQLAEVNRAVAGGPLQVEAFGPDNRTVIETGTLKVIDNQVDQTTGTIRLKAEFPNRDLKLWPGQFVNVRLLIDTLRDAVVAPTAAVQRGPNGTFVYVVQADGTVAIRSVAVRQQDETEAVIGHGVKARERVVTTGFARLTAGTQVKVTNAEAAPPPVAEPAEASQDMPAGRRQRRERRSDAGASTVR